MRFPVRWLSFFAVILALSAGLLAQPTSTPKKKHPKAPAATAATQQDVQALRDLVQAQQKQIETQGQQMQQLQEQLHEVLGAVQQANTNAQKAQTGVELAQATAVEAQQSAADAKHAATDASTVAGSAVSTTESLVANDKRQQSQLSNLADLAGRFRLSGDIRVRGEAYKQDGTQDRNRARIRVRLGLDGLLNQDFMGGVAIATGSQGDPTTTNETLTNAFDRKTIALDRGYIAYNPVAHSWLSVTAGKFPYLWQRTSVTGDPDLNPEGFDQKLSFNFHGPVQNFTIQALELLYNESSSGQDSYTLGGQAAVKLAAGPWSTTASFLTEHWNRPDALLQASAFEVGATTTGSGPISYPVPGEGPGCSTFGTLPKFPPCAFAPNGMTNATYLDASGKPHFFSGFDYADFILNNQIKTGVARFPVNLVLEFEDNLDAQAHPLDTTGKIIGSIGSQNKEYGGDLSVGQSKNKNDLQFGYSWYRQEQDSVLASIAESDQRAPTNILQDKVYAAWKLRSNVVANVTWWHGRVLNSYLENNTAVASKTISKAGQQEPYLNRFQFDLIYTY